MTLFCSDCTHSLVEVSVVMGLHVKYLQMKALILVSFSRWINQWNQKTCIEPIINIFFNQNMHQCINYSPTLPFSNCHKERILDSGAKWLRMVLLVSHIDSRLLDIFTAPLLQYWFTLFLTAHTSDRIIHLSY